MRHNYDQFNSKIMDNTCRNLTEIIVFYNTLFVTQDFGIDYKNNEANLMHI